MSPELNQPQIPCRLIEGLFAVVLDDAGSEASSEQPPGLIEGFMDCSVLVGRSSPRNSPREVVSGKNTLQGLLEKAVQAVSMEAFLAVPRVGGRLSAAAPD